MGYSCTCADSAESTALFTEVILGIVQPVQCAASLLGNHYFYKMRQKRYFKGTYPKSAKRSKSETIVTAGLQSSAVRQQLERIILSKSETKYVDNVSSVTAMSAAGQSVALSTVAQGSATNQRIGNHITSKYIHCRFVVEYNGTPCAYKFSLVLDKQPNAALAPPSAIWDMGTAQFAVALRAASTYGERFRVLKEIEGTVDAYHPVMYHDVYFSFDNLDDRLCRAEYIAGTAVVGSWATNQVLFAFGVAAAGAVANPPNISYTCRYAYKDA